MEEILHKKSKVAFKGANISGKKRFGDGVPEFLKA